MLDDVGLIDYIDMQRDVSNRPIFRVLVLDRLVQRSVGSPPLPLFESLWLLVIKNIYIVPYIILRALTFRLHMVAQQQVDVVGSSSMDHEQSSSSVDKNSIAD
eukprot:SAG11_NODE_4102_length_2064_cov_2.542494_1_plen_103_part_00